MKVLTNWLKRFEVNGYYPLSMFNIVLGIITWISVITGGISTVELISIEGFGEGMKEAFSQDNMYAGFVCLVGIASFVFLIVRNLKIGSVPKMIMYILAQLAVSALIVFIAISVIFFKGLGSNPDGTPRGGGSSGNSRTAQHADNPKSSSDSAYDYTSGQDELARSYGFKDAEDARLHGVDTKKMM